MTDNKPGAVPTGSMENQDTGPSLPAEVAAAFNEWMRRYTEDPDGFEVEFVTVVRFLEEQNDGKVPTYGDTSKAYLELLMKQLSAR